MEEGEHYLTPAEYKVISALVRGLDSKQVSDELHLSPLTVKSHLSRIAKRYETRGSAHMIHRLVQQGVLPVQRDAPVKLTYKQLVLLNALSLGYGRKQIAKGMKLTDWQVAYLFKTTFRALGADNRVQAIYRGYQTGNLTMPKPEENKK